MTVNKKLMAILFLGLSFCLQAKADTWETCEHLRDYDATLDYEIDCNEDYLHFNSEAYNRYYRYYSSELRIATYNLWTFGSPASRYQDLEIMAELMDQWDVIAVQEVFPLAVHDKKVNTEFIEYIEGSYSSRRMTNTLRKNLRHPHYIKLLNELRKLDQSWALILSPNPEGAEASNTSEFLGFYYRSRTAMPVENQHCEENSSSWHSEAIACFPNFSDEEKDAFSRRPFMATFESSGFEFTALSHHSIFNSPKDPELMSKILEPSFGISDYRELGRGANRKNYARHAELKLILDFMDEYKKDYDEKIMVLGDFNLKSNNLFLPKVLDFYNKIKLYNEEKTTITWRKYDSKGRSTHGLSNDYDHIFLNPKVFKNCDMTEVEVYNVTEGRIGSRIDDRYIVRREAFYSSERKKENAIDLYESKLASLMVLEDEELVEDFYRREERLEGLEMRLFDSQFSDSSYYRIYMEVLSDHLPVSFTCEL